VEGDIVVCLDEAARQAKKRNHPIRLEVLLYALHGMLHLLGYDDVSARQAARMHRREDACERWTSLRWNSYSTHTPSC
jgi:probable rRNA maturation factor